MKNKLIIIGITFLLPLKILACECEGGLDKITKKEQLNIYDFVAIVHIDNIEKIPNTTSLGYDSAKITISIKELFKGDTIRYIIEDYHYSSCGYGLKINSEWLLYAKKNNGEYHITPCDRNFIYRKSNGERFFEFSKNDSFPAYKVLRKLFNHKVSVQENGIKRIQYPNGNIEIEENYSNSNLHGERKIYYSSGQLKTKENYLNNLLDGEVTGYYETGQLSYKEFFSKGKHTGVSHAYSDSSESENFKKYLLQSGLVTKDELENKYSKIYITDEEYYNDTGGLILFRRFYWNGRVSHEEIPIDTDNLQCFDYNMNGTLKKAYTLNVKSEARTNEYTIESNE